MSILCVDATSIFVDDDPNILSISAISSSFLLLLGCLALVLPLLGDKIGGDNILDVGDVMISKSLLIELVGERSRDPASITKSFE